MQKRRTTEFHIRERVRFLPGALVTPTAHGIGRGTVEGYDEVGGDDYVIVRVVPKGMVAFDQWVLPGEIESEQRGVAHVEHSAGREHASV